MAQRYMACRQKSVTLRLRPSPGYYAAAELRHATARQADATGMLQEGALRCHFTLLQAATVVTLRDAAAVTLLLLQRERRCYDMLMPAATQYLDTKTYIDTLHMPGYATLPMMFTIRR